MTDQELQQRLRELKTRIREELDLFAAETCEYPEVSINKINATTIADQKPVFCYDIEAHITRRIE